jgi:hypothetical protein
MLNPAKFVHFFMEMLDPAKFGPNLGRIGMNLDQIWGCKAAGRATVSQPLRTASGSAGLDGTRKRTHRRQAGAYDWWCRIVGRRGGLGRRPGRVAWRWGPTSGRSRR